MIKTKRSKAFLFVTAALYGGSCLANDYELTVVDITIRGGIINQALVYKYEDEWYLPTSEINFDKFYLLEPDTYTMEFCDACYKMSDFAFIEYDPSKVALNLQVKKQAIPKKIETKPTLGEYGRGHFLNYNIRSSSNYGVTGSGNYLTSINNGTLRSDFSIRDEKITFNRTTYNYYLDEDRVIDVGDIQSSRATSSLSVKGLGIRYGFQERNLYSSAYGHGETIQYQTYAPGKYQLYRDDILVKSGEINEDIGEITGINISEVGEYRLEITDRFGDVTISNPTLLPLQGLLKQGGWLYDFSAGQRQIRIGKYEGYFTHAAAKYGIRKNLTLGAGVYHSDTTDDFDVGLNYINEFGRFDLFYSSIDGVENYLIRYNKRLKDINFDSVISKNNFGISTSYTFPANVNANFSYNHSSESDSYSLSVSKYFDNRATLSLAATKSIDSTISLNLSIPLGSYNSSIYINGEQSRAVISYNDRNTRWNAQLFENEFSKGQSLEYGVNTRYTSAFARTNTSNNNTDYSFGFSGTLISTEHGVIATRERVDGLLLVENTTSEPIHVDNRNEQKVMSNGHNMIPINAYRDNRVCFNTNKSDKDIVLKERCKISRVTPGQSELYKLKVLSGGIMITDETLDELDSRLDVISGSSRFSYYPGIGAFIEGLDSGKHLIEFKHEEQVVCSVNIELSLDYYELENPCSKSKEDTIFDLTEQNAEHFYEDGRVEESGGNQQNPDIYLSLTSQSGKLEISSEETLKSIAPELINYEQIEIIGSRRNPGIQIVVNELLRVGLRKRSINVVESESVDGVIRVSGKSALKVSRHSLSFEENINALRPEDYDFISKLTGNSNGFWFRIIPGGNSGEPIIRSLRIKEALQDNGVSEDNITILHRNNQSDVSIIEIYSRN